VTNPLNAYSQEDFKSRDVVLRFHVGLAIRIASRDEVPITEGAAALLPGAWRRWEQAVEALTTAQEAEDFQAVGVTLRECPVSFAAEISADAPTRTASRLAPASLDARCWFSRPWAGCRRSPRTGAPSTYFRNVSVPTRMVDAQS
jgi:hypothetical protein